MILARLRQPSTWVINEYCCPTRDHAGGACASTRLKDHRVIIVSGMFTSSLERIGERLGISDW
jgi:phosphoserine phosphatase